MVREVLEWADKKFEAIQSGEDTKHPYLKSFGLGVVEGAIDGAVMIYPFLLAALIIANKELKKKGSQ